MIIHNMPQYSDEWWAARLGKPSASCAKKLITSTGAPSKSLQDYAYDLANDLYAGEVVDAWEGNKHTDRGTELEPVARSLYEAINSCDVTEIGMFTDGKAVASPDGVIDENGILEIKCLTAKNHTKALVYYKKNNKPPTDYVAQCQFQLFISGYEYVDLFLYHPKLPELQVRVLPIKSHFEMLECQIEEVIEKRDSIIKLLNGE